MSDYLIVLNHEVDEEIDVLTPFVVQADDDEDARQIAKSVQSVLMEEYDAETSFKVVQL